jgi:hypothetical protein
MCLLSLYYLPFVGPPDTQPEASPQDKNQEEHDDENPALTTAVPATADNAPPAPTTAVPATEPTEETTGVCGQEKQSEVPRCHCTLCVQLCGQDGGIAEYALGWKGYSSEHNTWEPKAHVPDWALKQWEQYGKQQAIEAMEATQATKATRHEWHSQALKRQQNGLSSNGNNKESRKKRKK